MPKAGSSFMPLRDLWLVILPPLPLMLAALLVSSLIDPGDQLAFLALEASQFVDTPQRYFIHLGDMLTYYALASIHSILCLAVIVCFLRMMRDLPPQQRWNAIAFFLGSAVLIVGLVLYFKAYANDVVLVQLGYKAICLAIQSAELPTALVENCFEEGDISTLTLLAWIPTFSGMGAVIFAAAFAYGNAGALPALGHPDWRSVVAQRTKAMQRSVYALSAVLVSSTITITLFAQLPAGLLKDQKVMGAALSDYALGLSTFWGALFSLTLVATFAVPAFLLLRQAYQGQASGAQADGGQAGTRAAEDDLRSWLHDHVFVSIKKQLTTVASLLAPLLVGPLGSLLSSITGAG